MVVENLRVDVTPGGVPLVIHVSQYDAGLRQFVFAPYDKGVAMAKIAGATVAIEATKPDGYAVQHPCTYNNDGTITYTLKEQLAACEGQVWSKLTWRGSNGEILGAKAIVWAVDMAGIEDGAIVSESDLPLIEQAAEFASEYQEKVAEMISEMQIVPGQVVIDGTLTVQGAAADAKATGDRLADLQSAIEQIEPGLSAEAKRALLACFAGVAWRVQNGNELYEALRSALGSGVITGDMLQNIGYWNSTYPYYGASPKRLSYPQLDLAIEGGKIYRFVATPGQDDLNMYVNLFNAYVLAQAEIEGNISASDHLDALGGWSDVFDQTIVAPKRINGSPTAGLVFGFKDINNNDLTTDAIEKVDVKEQPVGALPSAYTAYDYIAAQGSGSTVAASYDGIISTDVYADLGQKIIALDYKVLSGAGTVNLPVVGVRSENNWNNVVCVYITGGDDYTIYSHGSFIVTDAVVADRITHLELRQRTATPTVFYENGINHSHDWANTLTVNAPLYLLVNPVYGAQQTSLALSNKVQLGQFVIYSGNDYDVYVPCVRNADQVIGIYSLKSGTFHTCSNINKATIGNANCIYQVGNWT